MAEPQYGLKLTMWSGTSLLANTDLWYEQQSNLCVKLLKILDLTSHLFPLMINKYNSIHM